MYDLGWEIVKWAVLASIGWLVAQAAGFVSGYPGVTLTAAGVLTASVASLGYWLIPNLPTMWRRLGLPGVVYLDHHRLALLGGEFASGYALVTLVLLAILFVKLERLRRQERNQNT